MESDHESRERLPSGMQMFAKGRMLFFKELSLEFEPLMTPAQSLA
jgi:hypothetical protein